MVRGDRALLAPGWEGELRPMASNPVSPPPHLVSCWSAEGEHLRTVMLHQGHTQPADITLRLQVKSSRHSGQECTCYVLGAYKKQAD